MDTKNFIVENGRVLYHFRGPKVGREACVYGSFLDAAVNRLRKVYPEYGCRSLYDVLKRHREGIYEDEIPEKIDNTLNKQVEYRNGYVRIDVKREKLSAFSHYCNKNISIFKSSDIEKVMQDILKYDDGEMGTVDFANLLYLCLCDVECKFDFVISGDGNEADLVVNSVLLTKEFVSMRGVLGLDWVLSIIEGSDSGSAVFYNDVLYVLPFPLKKELPEAITYTINERSNYRNEYERIEVDRKKLSSFSRSHKQIYVRKSTDIEVVLKQILRQNYNGELMKLKMIIRSRKTSFYCKFYGQMSVGTGLRQT